jgi:hypothetical protein
MYEITARRNKLDDPLVLEPERSELLPARSDESTLDAMDELRALTSVMEALRPITNDEARARILKAAASFFRVPLGPSSLPHSTMDSPSPRIQGPTPTAFSSERTVSPKDFIRDKQPKTDVERVACLAYYLTHYRETPHFKTIDISKLNTEAAQPKLSNAAMAVDNATKTHYLVPAAKGNKQISASGEFFVQALPNRDLARSEMQKFRPRKRRRTSVASSNEQAVEE